MQTCNSQRSRYIRQLVAVCAAMAVVSSCSSDRTTTSTSVSNNISTVAPATKPVARADVVIEGLVQPTQFLVLNDGRFLIAQLNGDENASLGQVLLIDPKDQKQRVLIDRLDKPTGLAYVNGVVWVMVKRGLVRALFDETTSTVGPTEIALADLPYNGRSEGTLTPLPDGRILYETSGDNEAGPITEGSGKLNAYDPVSKTSSIVATGLKNAYAHTVLANNRLLTTEVSAANSNPPPDELNVIDLETSTAGKPPYFGWPSCGPQVPKEGPCAQVTQPIVTLPDNSTPTGIAVIGSTAYVALWVSGEVRKIEFDSAKPDTIVAFDGFENPQHLVAESDTTLLLSEHGTGRILRLSLLR